MLVDYEEELESKKSHHLGFAIARCVGGGAEKNGDGGVEPPGGCCPLFFSSPRALSLLSPSQHTHTHVHNTRARPLHAAALSLSHTQHQQNNKKEAMSSTRNSPAEGGAADAKMRPPADAGVVEKVASPLATLSSHVDPWPHYIMSAACE